MDLGTIAQIEGNPDGLSVPAKVDDQQKCWQKAWDGAALYAGESYFAFLMYISAL